MMRLLKYTIKITAEKNAWV